MFGNDPNDRYFGTMEDGARAAVRVFGRWYFGPVLGGLFYEMFLASERTMSGTLNPPYDVA